MEKCKILEALANSFMDKTSKNTPHFLFDFAYTRDWTRVLYTLRRDSSLHC